MRRDQTETVREVRTGKDSPATPLRRLPQRTASSTKQMHNKLLRALSDRRIKRAFD